MRRQVLLAAALLCTLALGAAVAHAGRPLSTALYEPDYSSAERDTLFARTADAGAGYVRLLLDWRTIAPRAPALGADAENPANPGYDWATFDAQVRSAQAHGLAVIAALYDTPDWALVPPAPGAAASLPDPAALGQFAQAAAKRYSGSFGSLPRIRYWEVWNEPNIVLFLAPQFLGGLPFAPDWYRRMVNDVADGVKGVDAGNVVIAGSTAPFFDNTVTALDPDWGPLSFMRHLLCLSETLQPTCSDTVRFDIWSHHPYASGGPEHSAALPNDVSIADLPKMQAVLDAAQDAGHIVSSAPVKLWVTEVSWDSDPPDPGGVPEPLLSRWVSDGLYRMWEDGVSLVTWFTLRDMPLDSSGYQAGLYYRGDTVADDTAKPSLQAFRFPFVAYARRDQLTVWGRTPTGGAATVDIEQSFAGGWTALGTVTADADGIFQASFVSTGRGAVRAEIPALGATAVPFSLAQVPDKFFPPFGGAPLELNVAHPRPALPHAAAVSSAQRITAEQQLRSP